VNESRVILAFLVAATAAGCGGNGYRPDPPPTVVLVDSIMSESMEGPHAALVHRVEVRFGALTDTIPGVETPTQPIVTADGEVTGIAWEEGLPVRGFFYDPGTEHLQFVPLPEALVGYALSPDGAHIAYTTAREQGIVAVVRTWPAGEVVVEGVPAGGYPSGVIYDHVEWLDNEEVRISQRLDNFALDGNGDYRTEIHQRTFASIRGRSIRTDTTRVTR
jgi:hypothetical protein